MFGVETARVHFIETKDEIGVAKMLLRFLDCPYLYDKSLGFHNKEADGPHDYLDLVPPYYHPTYTDASGITKEDVIRGLRGGDFEFKGTALLGEIMGRIEIGPAPSSDNPLSYSHGKVCLRVYDPYTEKDEIDTVIHYLKNGA